METNIFSAIAHAFQAGGIWMYVILGIQVFSVAIIIERVVTLYVRKQTNQKSVAKSYEDDIKRGHLDKVVSKSKVHKGHSVSGVIHAGALVAQDLGGREEIQAKMDEILTFENEKLERRTAFLAMLGNVSTLVGLLGTITGMIQSFAAVSKVSGAEKAQLLAAGISEAMNCTAYGLIVAIPALVMYAVLTNRTNRLQEDLNQAATKAFNWLSFNIESVKPSKKSLG